MWSSPSQGRRAATVAMAIEVVGGVIAAVASVTVTEGDTATATVIAASDEWIVMLVANQDILPRIVPTATCKTSAGDVELKAIRSAIARILPPRGRMIVTAEVDTEVVAAVLMTAAEAAADMMIEMIVEEAAADTMTGHVIVLTTGLDTTTGRGIEVLTEVPTEVLTEVLTGISADLTMRGIGIAIVASMIVDVVQTMMMTENVPDMMMVTSNEEDSCESFVWV
mmetsp:Transcript_4928/g.9029  ORF Transcript_4928/g.9029 Transcript_4928/m.9029 type:complete len:224 (+) Transcript_4928:448-1119(+)